MKGKFVLLVALICLIGTSAYSQGIFDKTVSWGPRGSAHVPGSVSFANNVYTLKGNGDDIWNNDDEGFYVYKELSGSQAITARVNWVEPGANEWSKVGVMIREDGADAQSKTYYSILRGYNYGDRADAGWRLSTGGGSDSRQMYFDAPENLAPVEATAEGLWLRVTRIKEANIMVTEFSEDGKKWQIGHTLENFTMKDTVAYGLCITNHDDNTELVEATADNVSIAAPTIQLVLAKRSMPTSVLPEGGGKVAGAKITVDIVPSGQASATITETLPTGVTASNIKTTNGSASFSGGKITWNLTNASGSVAMTYDLDITAAAAKVGYVLFSGEMDKGGVKAAVAGIDSLFKVNWDVPFIDRKVTLDGEMSAGEYDGAYTEKFGHADGDTAPPGVHISGNAYPADKENVTFYMFHNRDYIYCALDVIDGDALEFVTGASVWQNDSAEIYFDGNLNRQTTKENGKYGFQATVLGNGAQTSGNDVPTPAQLANGGYASTDGPYWNFGAKVKGEKEYIVEYQITKAQILDPPDRTVVGFDILMNSNDGGNADRSGKWGYWTTRLDGTAGEYWNDETGWAVVQLVGGPVGLGDWDLH